MKTLIYEDLANIKESINYFETIKISNFYGNDETYKWIELEYTDPIDLFYLGRKSKLLEIQNI